MGSWTYERNVAFEVPLPDGWQRYGHFQVGPENDTVLVCDGYFEYPDEAPGGAHWISLVQVNWAEGSMQWKPLCQHGSLWDSQTAIPIRSGILKRIGYILLGLLMVCGEYVEWQ